MQLPTTLRMAARNLGRNRKRTVLAVGAIAIACALTILFLATMSGYSRWMIDLTTGPLVGNVQVHAPQWRDDRAMDRVIPDSAAKARAIRAVPGVTQVVERVYGPALIAQSQEGQAAMVIGLSVADERRDLLAKVPDAQLPGPGQALVGRDLAASQRIKAGDTLAIIGQGADGSIANGLVVVSGVVSTPVELINRLGVVLPLADARALLVMEGAAHELVIHGGDPTRADQLAASVRGLPQLQGLEVLDWRVVAPEYAQMVDLLGGFDLVLAALVFVAAAAGIANTLMMSTFERTRELGMLLALGTRPSKLVTLMVLEAVALGIAGAVAGLALGMAGALWLGRVGFVIPGAGEGEGLSFVGADWSARVFPRLEANDVWVALGAVLVTCLLASIWPAARAARLQPVEAMRS